MIIRISAACSRFGELCDWFDEYWPGWTRRKVILDIEVMSMDIRPNGQEDFNFIYEIEINDMMIEDLTLIKLCWDVVWVK